MGLANLVPGISGGTMLLAAGIYPRFIEAMAEVTTLRLRRPSVLVLASVVGSAGVSILLLAGPVKDLVVGQRWIMYSLFVGLTLGGLPVVWKMARPGNLAVWLGAGAGLLAMVGLALTTNAAGTASAGGSNPLLLVVAGVAGASAMILPGVSGGYLLLLLGQYVPILSAIELFESALRAGDLSRALDPALRVLVPVALGVGVGVAAIANLVRWLLRRFEKATLGVLLGLLLGAVVGLWPFQRAVSPVLGETVIRGQVVTAENLTQFEAEDYPTAYFTPTTPQVLAALGLVVLGTALTTAVARLGEAKRDARRL